MARRTAKKRVRRKQSGIKILSVLESYAYASIMTAGLFGNTPWGFVFDKSDIPLKGME